MEARVGDAFQAIAAGHNPQAENFLQQAVAENIGQFVQAVALVIADDSKELGARSQAAVYLKNLLMGQSALVQKEKHERWRALPREARDPVKESLMTAMRNHNVPGLLHYCGMASAEIAAFELPWKEWPTFLTALQENVTSPQSHDSVKKASLECLGYMCDRIVDIEDMMLGDFPELDASLINSVLTTIAAATQETQGDDIRMTALSALKNSLLFIKKNMETPAERDFIMNAIFAGTTTTDPNFRVLAFSCIDTVVEYYYEHMADHMTKIFELTTGAIKNENEEFEVRSGAIEIWNTLAENEATMLDEEREAATVGTPLERHSNKYVAAALQHYVPLMLALLIHQNEDDNDDEPTLQDKAATCLELMSMAVEGQIVQHVVPFVEQNIQLDEWRRRDAAIVAFMAILEGPSTAELSQYVSQSVQIMIENFGHQQNVVRVSAVHCVRKIAAHHLSALNEEQVRQILEAVDGKLSDRTTVAAACCSTIYEICMHLKQVPPPPTNILSGGLVNLINDLLNVTERQDANETNLRVVAMSAAGAVISASAADVQPVFPDLVKTLAERLDKYLSGEGAVEGARAQMIGQLLALVQTLYQRMEKAAVLPLTDVVMRLVLRAIPIHIVQEEAYMAVGAIISNLEEDFEKYLQEYIPHLMSGLGQLHFADVVTICAGNVVDLCGGLGAKMTHHARPIMEALFAIIRDSNVHRDVKPAVISCFGDVAMAIGKEYQPYLELTLMLLMQASQQLVPPNNDEMKAFINKLRCACLEAYSGILVGFAEAGALDVFTTQGLPNILSFCHQLSGDSTKDEVVLQKAVTLLGDVAHEYAHRSFSELQQFLRGQPAQILLHEALGNPNPSIQDDARWAATQVQNLPNIPPQPVQANA